MLKNPIKLYAVLNVPGSKSAIARAYTNDEIPSGTLGHVMVKSARPMPVSEITWPTTEAFLDDIGNHGFEYELVKQLSRAEVNTSPDKATVTNMSDLAKFGTDVLSKMEDPTALGALLFTKPFSQYGETELVEMIERIRTVFNIHRTTALQRGVTIRQQKNKLASDADDEATNIRHAKSPSAKKKLVDDAKKSGDKKRMSVLKMFMVLDLEDKYPGYQKFSTGQLQEAIAKENNKILGK